MAYIFHEKLFALVQAPLTKIGKSLVFTHPMDPLNIYLQVSLIGGAIIFVAFHPLPGVDVHCAGALPERAALRDSVMAATVGLFFGRRQFGYFWVLPGALKILIVDFGHNFTSMVTIEEYSGFFLSIILGLGISFEMPILIFFLALFGIVSPGFCGRTSATRFWQFSGGGHYHAQSRPVDHVHLRHPHADSLPDRDRRGLVGSSLAAQGETSEEGQEGQGGRQVILSSFWKRAAAGMILLAPLAAPAQQHFNGAKAYEYARQFVAIGPRWPTGPGHLKAEAYLRNQFKRDQVEEDTFTANTPIGVVPHAQLHRALPRQEERRDCVGNALRDPNYPLRTTSFAGANDGGRDDRAADGDCRPTARQGARRLLGVAGVFSTARKRSGAGPTPTRHTAAATWPPSGAGTEPWDGSRPSCWPT